MVWDRSTVKCKRNYSEYTLPYKSTPAAKQKTILSGRIPGKEQSSKKEELTENVYIYQQGTIPPSRQMFYQVCNKIQLTMLNIFEISNVKSPF